MNKYVLMKLIKQASIISIISIVILINASTSDSNNKQEVDFIISNGVVLTMNSYMEIIEQGVVVISNTEIIDVGTNELLDKYTGKKIDAENGIIMPGMINTHTHAAMSVFRSLADDVPDRLNRFIFPLESEIVDFNLVYNGTLHSAIEMIKGGVTTIVDMYLFEEAAAEAIKKAGLRGVLTQNIIRFPTPDGQTSKELIERAVKLIEKYSEDELITPGFGPHAPHTVERESLELIKELSDKYNAPVSMHVAETQEEFDYFEEEFNMTPIQYLDSIGLLNERFIAAHSIFITDDDIEILKKRNVGVSHNMIANIKSAKGVSPALKMYEHGVRIGLGTDGPMSGNTLDIIRQLGYVATIHKLVNEDRSVMPAKDVVNMATMGGARALNMEDSIGSIEKGKLADIIIIETDSINMSPFYDPYSVLVYSANSSNVNTVLINGKVIVDDKKFKKFDKSFLDEEMDKLQMLVEKEVDKILNN